MTQPDELTALARRYRLEINLGTYSVPTWTVVPGVVEFKPMVSPTIQDDSDYDGEGWTGNTKTAQGWSLELKVSHKVNLDTGAWNPAHAALKAASEAFNAASYVDIRYYDRGGSPDAQRGRALVTWAPDGGDQAQLDRVTVTLTGDKQLVTIVNPLADDPDPIVASLTPATGDEAGGELITIQGAFFIDADGDPATGVSFGANPSTDFVVHSTSLISAVAPAGTGTVNVTVTTGAGASETGPGNQYVYTA